MEMVKYDVLNFDWDVWWLITFDEVVVALVFVVTSVVVVISVVVEISLVVVITVVVVISVVVSPLEKLKVWPCIWAPLSDMPFREKLPPLVNPFVSDAYCWVVPLVHIDATILPAYKAIERCMSRPFCLSIQLKIMASNSSSWSFVYALNTPSNVSTILGSWFRVLVVSIWSEGILTMRLGNEHLMLSLFKYTSNMYMPVWSMTMLENVAVLVLVSKETINDEVVVSEPFVEQAIKLCNETLACHTSFFY